MKMISRLIALGTFLVLAGCGTWTAESYLHETISGDSFNACLAREYQERATSEAYVDCNWVDTARSSQRAAPRLLARRFSLGSGDARRASGRSA